MELYRNTTSVFIDYLKRHGYPESCIALEWGTRQCTIDVAILAKDEITPIAIYEIKGSKTPQTIKHGISQLSRASQMLNFTVPCNLVFSKRLEPYFEAIDVSDIIYNKSELDVSSIMEEHPVSTPISYKNMQLGISSKTFIRKQEIKQEHIDKLKPICWIVIPILVLIILVLDALHIYKLTFEKTSCAK